MPVPRPKFSLSDDYSQLALGLDLPEIDEGMSVEQARLRSESSRAAFLQLKGQAEQPEWFERFESLLDGGWPWRQACYIAWASMPMDGRLPKTQEELARIHLGLNSDRAISTWRKKNPAIDTMIAILQSAELWQHRADSFQNLIKGMKQAGSDYKFFNHLKLYMEMTGDYVPLNQIAAVLKRKADGGAHELDEETLNDLEESAKELESIFPSVTDASPHDEGDESSEGE